MGRVQKGPIGAAPVPTITFLLASLPVGALFLLPSLWPLFRVFKMAKAEA